MCLELIDLKKVFFRLSDNNIYCGISSVEATDLHLASISDKTHWHCLQIEFALHVDLK